MRVLPYQRLSCPPLFAVFKCLHLFTVFTPRVAHRVVFLHPLVDPSGSAECLGQTWFLQQWPQTRLPGCYAAPVTPRLGCLVAMQRQWPPDSAGWLLCSASDPRLGWLVAMQCQCLLSRLSVCCVTSRPVPKPILSSSPLSVSETGVLSTNCQPYRTSSSCHTVWRTSLPFVLSAGAGAL